MKNYQVSIIFRGYQYDTDFEEYWLAKTFAEAISIDEDVATVYISIRNTFTEKFEIVKKVK